MLSLRSAPARGPPLTTSHWAKTDCQNGEEIPFRVHQLQSAIDQGPTFASPG